MDLGEERWWSGIFLGRRFAVKTQIRLEDTRFYFMTPSNARINFGASKSRKLDKALSEQFVDLVIEEPRELVDFEIEFLKLSAQAEDTRPVRVRLKGETLDKGR